MQIKIWQHHGSWCASSTDLEQGSIEGTLETVIEQVQEWVEYKHEYPLNDPSALSTLTLGINVNA